MRGFFVLVLLGANHHLFAEVAPELIQLESERVYFPKGFDDNDVAQVIIEANLPDPCHRVQQVELQREENRFSFRIHAYQYELSCPEVITPVIEVLDLGILEVGSYLLFDLEDEDRSYRGELKVAKATSSRRDSHLYAPVDSAYFVYKKSNAKTTARQLALVGEFPSSCMRFSPKTSIQKTDEKLLEILPILEEEGLDCDTSSSFTHLVDVPESIPADRYLLHVRTMSGKSFNKLDRLRALGDR